jgi:hypothetical protein
MKQIFATTGSTSVVAPRREPPDALVRGRRIELNSRCPKLAAAYNLLIELLAPGPVSVSTCVARARDLEISEATLYAARPRLPIAASRAPWRDGGAYWSLAGDAADAPTSWKPLRPPKPCAGCGKLMAGAHGLRQRCRPCRLALNVARERKRYASRALVI